MEDGAVGGFVQRGIAGADEQEAVIEMGGDEPSRARAGHRSLGAGLLEGLSHAHGLEGEAMYRSAEPADFNAAYARTIDTDATGAVAGFFTERLPLPHHPRRERARRPARRHRLCRLARHARRPRRGAARGQHLRAPPLPPPAGPPGIHSMEDGAQRDALHRGAHHGDGTTVFYATGDYRDRFPAGSRKLVERIAVCDSTVRHAAGAAAMNSVGRTS